MTVYARVTTVELDPVRIDIDDAVEMYEREVVPALRELDGYCGAYVLTNPDGKALLVAFWATEKQAETNPGAGFYPETLARYATIFRAPPGRDRYRVAFADTPVGVLT
ncbi:MAG TPA: hypothetical protein VFU10_01325 [Gaiellaceae bacterium]|nr:hypothetical protein [Gaiellaceae bacterium]